jgi:hypothetical protein
MSHVKKRKCCCDRHEAEDHNPGRIERLDSFSDGGGDRLAAWTAADEDRIMGLLRAGEETPGVATSADRALRGKLTAQAESARQTEDLNPAVLKEMAIERESAADSPHTQNRKRNRVIKTPVFVRVSRDDFPAAILLLR